MIPRSASSRALSAPLCRYFRTSDGAERILTAGDIMYQDNTEDSPVEISPLHSSGNAGDEPVNLLLTFVDIPAAVNVLCPFN